MTEAKLVCSRYVNIIEHEKKKIAFHALYGNPVNIDNDVIRLLSELRNPLPLSSLALRSDDYQSALKELTNIGFLLPYDDQDKEFLIWKDNLYRRYAGEHIFSDGIIFLLTTRCNLNCSYCICSHSLQKRQDMTCGTAYAILDWYLNYMNKQNDISNPLFIFTGGEPLLQISLLKKIITEIDSRIPQLKPLFRIISNGTLITKQISRFLEDHNIDLIISIDGDQVVHDIHRPFAAGGPSWNKIWAGINLFSSLYRKNNLSVSSVYEEDMSLNNWDVLLKKLHEHGIFYWTINLNNLATPENPEETAGKIIELRKYAKKNYNILVSGRWATPAANIRSGKRFNAICSASGRNRIFFQPDGAVTFCDYDPRKLSNIDEIEDYVNLAAEERERYFFGNWKVCSDCMLAGFCSPCVLEEEVLHSDNARFQDHKCRFIKECTKLLMFE